ncbi:MAG: ribosome maturation factor [Ignavibacteria bacterium]|nr:ribosome maturation factor [Ignavibacteria bacterium]
MEEIIKSVIEATDYRIIELVIRGEKRTKVLEVFVDRKEGVNIDELAEISRELERRIEESHYAGELLKIIVSSPGIDRPFRYIWQLDKHVGRTLWLRLNDGSELEGKLNAVSDEAGELMILVAPDGKKKSDPVEALIKFKDVKEAKVKISFSKK